MIKILLFLLLIALWSCVPVFPKGFYCWQNKEGYLVCQFVPADQEENKSR